MSLNNIIDEIDLTNTYRAFHPKEAKYTFFSSVHGTFSKRDYMIAQSKPEWIQENWNHIKHFLWPQGTETRNQPQRKKQNTQNHGDWIACY